MKMARCSLGALRRATRAALERAEEAREDELAARKRQAISSESSASSVNSERQCDPEQALPSLATELSAARQELQVRNEQLQSLQSQFEEFQSRAEEELQALQAANRELRISSEKDCQSDQEYQRVQGALQTAETQHQKALQQIANLSADLEQERERHRANQQQRDAAVHQVRQLQKATKAADSQMEKLQALGEWQRQVLLGLAARYQAHASEEHVDSGHLPQLLQELAHGIGAEEGNDFARRLEHLVDQLLEERRAANLALKSLSEVAVEKNCTDEVFDVQSDPLFWEDLARSTPNFV